MKTINTNHACTNTAADAIRQWVAADSKAGTSKLKAVDALFADGVVPADLESPAKGADRTAYDSFRFAVVQGFAAPARKMVEADKAVAKGFAKVTEEEAKADRLATNDKNRRYWQQQIGSKLKDLRAALITRYEAKRIAELTPEQLAAEQAEAEATASIEARMGKVASEWVARLEKTEAAAFNVADAIKLFKQIAAMASAEVTKH